MSERRSEFNDGRRRDLLAVALGVAAGGVASCASSRGSPPLSTGDFKMRAYPGQRA